ncbi:MAG: hypothetical protein IPI49_20670 [Myxococcales bacterium]|nr:hypothetical protein [Myxococcales bacterium]
MRLQPSHLSWIFKAATVVSCASLAAQTVSHLLESSLLKEATAAVVRRPAGADPASRPRHSKDGRQLVERNLFCSDCAPPAPGVADPFGVTITSLPLSLLATSVSADPSRSMASIVHLDSHRQGGYRVGDVLAGAGPVKVVRYRSIDFEHAGRIERLLLTGGPSPAAATQGAAAPEPAPSAPASEPDALAAALAEGVRKVKDGSYVLDRALVDQVLANPMAFLKGTRAVPAIVDGKPVGFKLYAVRPGSAVARLGLVNGDTLQALGGFELGSMEAAMNAYTTLREATSLELTVLRRGERITLRYAVR